MVLPLGACGSGVSHGDPRSAGQIDERTGTYKGVGLDDSADRVEQVFGRPAPFRGNLTPVGHDYYAIGGPLAIRKPHRVPDGALRYRSVSFHVAARTVYAVEVVADGARTKRGVRIGEPLAEARRLQPSLKCGTAFAGTDFPSFPYCSGKVAPHVYIWIGQDPVRSITLARSPFGH